MTPLLVTWVVLPMLVVLVAIAILITLAIRGKGVVIGGPLIKWGAGVVLGGLVILGAGVTVVLGTWIIWATLVGIGALVILRVLVVLGLWVESILGAQGGVLGVRAVVLAGAVAVAVPSIGIVARRAILAALGGASAIGPAGRVRAMAVPLVGAGHVTGADDLSQARKVVAVGVSPGEMLAPGSIWGPIEAEAVKLGVISRWWRKRAQGPWLDFWLWGNHLV